MPSVENMPRLARTMLLMATNAEGREVHVAWPKEKHAVTYLEKEGLVTVRRTKDKIGGMTEWWFKLAPKRARSRDQRRGPMSGAELRAEDRAGAYAWEVWSLGDRYEAPLYIASYKDKGEAERHMRRLQATHRGYRYTLKHRIQAARHLTGGGRATRRGRAAMGY